VRGEDHGRDRDPEGAAELTHRAVHRPRYCLTERPD
jgi:hypothetical protein